MSFGDQTPEESRRAGCMVYSIFIIIVAAVFLLCFFVGAVVQSWT